MKVSSFSEIESEFIERAHKMVWCSMATLDTRNRLRSRVIHPIWESSTGWATARRHSLKSRHIAHNPYVSLAYIADVIRPVYVDCRAEWEDERFTKQRVWDMFGAAAPPLGFDPGNIFKGLDDPEFGLLKLTPWRVELFDISDSESRRVWLRDQAS
jgi:general stress protein 26